ncbi:MAG: hypothetical protein HYZ50_08225 [Deltaproteobacteria bacterium]|nr:hypothetical protein [Deltaproteobacteria bacterium]
MRRWIARFLLLLVFAWVDGALSSIFAQGCAMCRTVMPQANEPIARGMFWSVLFLMTAPFAVSAIIGGWLFQQYRRARRYHQEKEST